MNKNEKKIKFKKALKGAAKNLISSFPIMISVLLFINLVNVFVKDYYLKIFTGNLALDSFLGALAGSLSFGSPVTSYIIGGELLKEGISLVAVCAFMVSWTTVGMIMLPLEAKYFGKKFAFVRNAINFVFAIIVAISTVFTLKFFQ